MVAIAACAGRRQPVLARRLFERVESHAVRGHDDLSFRDLPASRAICPAGPDRARHLLVPRGAFSRMSFGLLRATFPTVTCEGRYHPNVCC